MAQEQKQPKKSSETQEQAEGASQSDVSERKEQLDEDIDAILGEIDDVLETNAEDFVKSFIQKGGAEHLSDSRLGPAFLASGSSSFAAFLSEQAPELLPSRRSLP